MTNAIIDSILIIVMFVLIYVFLGSSDICNGRNPNHPYPAPKKWYVVTNVSVVLIIVDMIAIIVRLAVR